MAAIYNHERRMGDRNTVLRGIKPTGPGTGTNMLHVTRMMKDIDPSRPIRFILVEGPEQFKPEYWNRVVAVFTTGQAWQFKSYKWGQAPDSVASWGHRVIACAVDRWRDAPDAARFRDKEVVEAIWKAVESSMRSKGWKRDAAPTKI
ncbi:unnamed protein product [Parascedosporium putredinis]|uniref:Cell division control protein 73 C-terminal domain-containing protein n=1 Tax=Parascedosporium putredinis TaxID=1442378 RepID=A0A9P1GUS6_9PEZI|nr:unnamed protein product [Parascedosporium putredinis]CAI7987726.1 unnamed protein product [Parascedosporium putredinis]